MKHSLFTLALLLLVVTGCKDENKASETPFTNNELNDTEASPITDKTWVLTVLEGQDVVKEASMERNISFKLNSKDKRIEGFSGCNTFTGSYIIEDGQRIHFSGLASTLKSCPDVDMDEAEVMEVFQTADNFTISRNTLNLNVGKRAPLAVFESN